MSAPFGDVTIVEEDSPVLLASAGIGCTPMISMLGHLAAKGSSRQVIVVHADRSPSTHPLRADLQQLVAKLPHAAAHLWYEHPEGDWPSGRTGRVDFSDVSIPHGTTAYLCGPLPFLRHARTQLGELGLPASAIHYEVFGPDLWLGDMTGLRI